MIKRILTVSAMAVFCVAGLAACGEKSEGDKAKDAVDAGADKAKSAIDEATKAK